MNARGGFYLIYLILALITLAAKPAFGQGKAAVGTPQQRSASEHAGDTLRRPKPGANNFYVVLSRIQVSF